MRAQTVTVPCTLLFLTLESSPCTASSLNFSQSKPVTSSHISAIPHCPGGMFSEGVLGHWEMGKQGMSRGSSYIYYVSYCCHQTLEQKKLGEEALAHYLKG